MKEKTPLLHKFVYFQMPLNKASSGPKSVVRYHVSFYAKKLFGIITKSVTKNLLSRTPVTDGMCDLVFLLVTLLIVCG